MSESKHKNALWVAVVVAIALALWPSSAAAYVGPGAGIAVGTTVLALVVSAVVVILGLLLWPLRTAYRLITRKRLPKQPAIRRAVVVGLDGLDPQIARGLMADGQLPNLQRLAELGTMSDLATTYPAMSPVAWSSFATGVDPGKHGIFDFLTRDPKTYQPDLSSADIRPPARHLRLGKYRVPIGKPQLALLRKSKPFWELLARYRVPCSVLRVPITFPPGDFEGTMLSAMCVPDLQGSQGTFSYFSSDPDRARAGIGGRFAPLEVDRSRPGHLRFEAELEGPPNPIRVDGAPLGARFRVDAELESGRAELRLGGRRVRLAVGEYTDWLPVSFRLGLGMKMRGICRFRLLALEPEVRLYVTPINIDPENPILPISHPRYFAIFLAKLIGRYATLGLAEDTWALNEGVLDEEAFLEQAWANHGEREAMFFEMLRRTPRGLITCVFDGSDRIQHMFMRYFVDDHPALSADRAGNGAERERYRDVIPKTYRRLDDMVGRVMAQVDPTDPQNLVAVLSDHGFQNFRRGVNLNSWLLANGYLALKEGRSQTGEWFEGVDWSRSRAFALGLGGIFLNLAGREAHGIVDPSEANALADQIAAELTGLRDEAEDAVAIREAYAAHRLFSGPYAENAPDLVVGYAAGWRASWDGVRGIADGTVFSDNCKAWSGDHCIDPELVPGVLVANRSLGEGGERGRTIADLAPTILELFGVPAPKHMDGRSLVIAP